MGPILSRLVRGLSIDLHGIPDILGGRDDVDSHLWPMERRLR